jgi:hypothetical protein
MAGVLYFDYRFQYLSCWYTKFYLLKSSPAGFWFLQGTSCLPGYKFRPFCPVPVRIQRIATPCANGSGQPAKSPVSGCCFGIGTTGC